MSFTHVKPTVHMFPTGNRRSIAAMARPSSQIARERQEAASHVIRSSPQADRGFHDCGFESRLASLAGTLVIDRGEAGRADGLRAPAVAARRMERGC
jgi:hypothetical protein